MREANQDFPISSLLGRRKSEEGGRKEINTVERERRASCRNVRGRPLVGLKCKDVQASTMLIELNQWC